MSRKRKTATLRVLPAGTKMPRKEVARFLELRKFCDQVDTALGQLRRQYLDQEQATLLHRAKADEESRRLVEEFGRRTIKGFDPARYDFDVKAHVLRKRPRGA